MNSIPSENYTELEYLSVRIDGLASMSQALRDCFMEGPFAPETYIDAVDLLATLMYEFKNKYNAVIEQINVEKKTE